MHLPTLYRLVSTLILALALVACGNNESDLQPTATSAPPTAEPGQLTVGDLVAQAEEPWAEVKLMRTTSRSGPVPTEGDAPTPITGSVQDWTSDGDRYIVEFQDGSVVNEQLYADGTVYMRGQFVTSAVAPQVDANTWVILNPDVVPADTPVGQRLEYLMRPQETAFGPLTKQTLAQPVTEAGTVTVGERSCTMYTYGDASGSGNELRVEIAVDERGLPCQIIQRAGGQQNSTVYEYDIPGVDVVAPIEEATPVSGTPEG